ncbi:MAG: hypothetical protein RSD99_32820, partial [Janthinobacterium sp.]
LATPALLRLSEVRASRMEVKFMYVVRLKLRGAVLQPAGAAFFGEVSDGSRRPGERTAGARAGQSVILLLSRNNFSRKDA